MRTLSRASAGLLSVAATLTFGVVPLLSRDDTSSEVACSELSAMSWGGFAIDEAEARPAEGTTPAHCVVRGTIDTEIRFELLLPTPEAWNGRFVAGGGGGFVGSVQNQAMSYSVPAPSPLTQGFATVGTDTGHSGTGLDASWAFEREDREINFGHRAVHVTVEAAKAIIRVHYGRDIEYSYFLGCSRGGGQAMMSSQRYPDDFDGIVAAAPAYDWPSLGAHFLQIQQAMYPDPSDLSAPVVGSETSQLLEEAILDACDAFDGVTDGFLNDPRACQFKPEDLPRCASGNAEEGCVTDQQLAAIQTVYRGLLIDGEQVYPGYPFGGESDQQGWGAWITGGLDAFGPGSPSLHFAFGTQMYKYLVFDDHEWDYSSYDFSNWRTETERAAGILNATESDLTPFKVGGGKLILWNGWSDPAISALGTIEYFEEVQAEHEDADSFSRLFLLPGVLHCNGGPGPDQVDWLGTIQGWVEYGEAPDQVTATKTDADGNIEMRRPVCAYPAVAEYDGSGDPTREESFACVGPG